MLPDVLYLRLPQPAVFADWLEWHLSLSVPASPLGLPYEGMAPSGPLYFLPKATPPTMPPILGAPSVGLKSSAIPISSYQYPVVARNRIC